MVVDIDRIQKHYDHAVRKHPLFCNTLTRKSAGQWMMDENKDKATLSLLADKGIVGADDVLRSEVSEVFSAISQNDLVHAIDECYDAIAVLLRIADVLTLKVKPQRMAGRRRKNA